MNVVLETSAIPDLPGISGRKIKDHKSISSFPQKNRFGYIGYIQTGTIDMIAEQQREYRASSSGKVAPFVRPLLAMAKEHEARGPKTQGISMYGPVGEAIDQGTPRRNRRR